MTQLFFFFFFSVCSTSSSSTSKNNTRTRSVHTSIFCAIEVAKEPEWKKEKKAGNKWKKVYDPLCEAKGIRRKVNFLDAKVMG